MPEKKLKVFFRDSHLRHFPLTALVKIQNVSYTYCELLLES